MGRLIEAFAQFFDDDGEPLVNGWLEFLESNTNNTLKDTYYDENLQTVNENPLQLDAAGRCPSVFGEGSYRVVSYTRNLEDESDLGEQIQVFDPVTAAGDAGSGGGGAGLVSWSASDTYDVGDIVSYNNKVYRSLVNTNFNLNPAVETSSWEEIEFLQVWNINVTYEVDSAVHYDGNLYTSLMSLNTGNQPDESTSYWRAIASDYYATSVKTTDYEILPSERGNFFILGSTAVTDSQFDLPVMGATTDLFRVGIYNLSDYALTLSALDAKPIWIDSGSIILAKGTSVDLIYVNAVGAWIALNNVAPILGGQNIGTAAVPVEDIYSTVLHETTVPDSENLYFGTDQDAYILHDGSDWYIRSSVGALTLGTIDTEALYLATNNLLRWAVSSDGHFLPQAGDSYDIGELTTTIRNIFMGDSGQIVFGTDQDAYIKHDGSNFYVVTENGIMYITNATANAIVFGTDSIARWGLNSSGHLIPNLDDSYDIGSSSFLVQNIWVAGPPDADNKAANKAYVDSMSGYNNNILINPGFYINQRAISSGTNIASAGSYFLDRWRTAVANVAAVWANGILTLPPNDSVEQVIEAINIPAGTYTLSWEGDAIASVDGGADQTSPYTFVVSGGSNVTVEFTADASSRTVSEPVLVRGSSAVPFSSRSIQEEMTLCERYYQKVNYNYSGSSISGVYYMAETTFKINMRYTASAVVTTSSRVVRGFPSTAPNTFMLRPGIGTPDDYVGIRVADYANTDYNEAYFYGYAIINCEL